MAPLQNRASAPVLPGFDEPYTGCMPVEDKHQSEATPGGPSWALMLFFIALAIAVAVGIAWLMIHPLIDRR